MPNLIFKKDKTNIIIKKIINLKTWLFVWYKSSPPSVAYIAKELTTPNIKMQTNRI